MIAFNYSYLIRKSLNSFLRFPLVVIFSFITFISGSIFTLGYKFVWQHLFYISAIAVPFFISLNLILEKYETSKKFNYFANIFFLLIFFLVFINSPLNDFYLKHLYRYIFLFISFSFSIFYLPYLGFDNKLSFWHFNRIVLKSFFLALLYAGIILITISVLIWTVFELFNLENVNKIIYIVSLFSLAFILPWIFISGIPKQKIYNTHFITSYPESLLTLVNNLLIPLQVLFFITLIVVIIIKLLILPNVNSYFILLKLLILYFTINISIIAIIHPVLFEERNAKLLKFINLSIVFSLFLLALYFYFLFEIFNINVYFLNRYIYAIIGISFGIMFIYLLLKQLKDIRVIPLSIMIIFFLSVSGPWNFLNFYKSYLIKNLKNNFNPELKKHFISFYGINAFCKKINANECKEFSNNLKDFRSENYALTSNPYIKIIPQYKNIILEIDKKTTLLSFNFKQNNFKHIFYLDKEEYKVYFNNIDNSLNIFINETIDASFRLDSLLKKVANNNQNEIALSQNDLKFYLKGNTNNYNVFFDAISIKFNTQSQKYTVESLNGFLLILKK